MSGAQLAPPATATGVAAGTTLVGGVWSDDGTPFPVLDKYTGATVASVAATPAERLRAALDTVVAAAEQGPPPPHRRAAVLRRGAELVERDRAVFAETLTVEAGFTAADAAGEVDRAVVTLGLCAEEATRLGGDGIDFSSSPGQEHRLGVTLRVPIGVVAAITPFNSPLNTVLHKIGPALAAGNAVALKPSEHTPLTATLLCRVLLEAGLPPETLTLVQGGPEAGEGLLADPRVGFYAFTGSTEVGVRIRAAAGVRPVQLELGSIASTIVCADADLDRVVAKVANAAFRKAGQVCTSVQRLYVEAAVHDEVIERLAEAARAMPAGDPRDPATRVGPLIALEAAERVERWVEEATRAGARVVVGGQRTRAVHQPTVLADVAPGMSVVDREVFGPVLGVQRFDALEQALDGANDSPYGLAAGVFTRDIDRGLQAARGLRVGAVHLNEASSARADAMPFGGVKASGHGHEGPFRAVREMTEERLVTFNPT